MVSRCFLSWPGEASSHFFMPKPASQRFPVRAAVRKKRAESIRPLQLGEKGFFDKLSKFSELQKVLKTEDFNGAGHPSWVSRAHSSFP